MCLSIFYFCCLCNVHKYTLIRRRRRRRRKYINSKVITFDNDSDDDDDDVDDDNNTCRSCTSSICIILNKPKGHNLSLA